MQLYSNLRHPTYPTFLFPYFFPFPLKDDSLGTQKMRLLAKSGIFTDLLLAC